MPTLMTLKSGTLSPIEHPNSMRKIKVLFLSRISLISIGSIVALLSWMYVLGAMALPRANVRNFSGEFPTVSDKEGNFRLAILGDSRRDIETLEAILHDAVAQRADAAIILGDLVDGGNWPSLHFVRMEIGEEVPTLPVFTVVGNHDLSSNVGGNSKSFQECFGPDRFWLRAGSRLLVSIDNNTKKDWTSQIAWLERTLKEQGTDNGEIFLFMHKPPKGRGLILEHHLSHQMSQDLAAVLEPYRRRTTIFASHIHGNLVEDFNGMTVYINGEAGAPQDISPPVNGYLMLDCKTDKCRVEHLTVPTQPMERFEKYLMVDLFWMWPVLGLVLPFGLHGLLRRRKPPPDRNI